MTRHNWLGSTFQGAAASDMPLLLVAGGLLVTVGTCAAGTPAPGVVGDTSKLGAGREAQSSPQGSSTESEDGALAPKVSLAPRMGTEPFTVSAPAFDNFALTPTNAQQVALKTVAQAPVAPATAVPAAPATAAPAPPVAAKADELPLEPLNRTQFFLQPNAPQVVKWRMVGAVAKLTCEVRDYNDRLVASPTAQVQNGEAQLGLSLPAGFYELTCQPGGQRFGVVSLAPHEGAPDPFFAIDGALSWLETRPEMRTDLVALLKRSGIGLARERLSWGAVNPRIGQWDWVTNRNFDGLRQDYARQGVQVLELFHSAPEWTKIDATNLYPQRLASTKDSWQAMSKHWGRVWNALEVWNEPDIETGGELPADQYLPLVKTINYALHENRMSTLVGGGVFGYLNPAYIRNAVQNGLLDQVDFVSFHTYTKAPAMEQTISDYQRALTVPGRAPIPLWITESGQPWKNGLGRPPTAEDALSAREITMKAVEARACGIARYFAFVYPYFPEGVKNLGMMGQEVTPLRSMAAYAQSVAALSGTTYVGDLNLKNALVQRARVFAQGDNAVVVLYAENPDADSSVAWTGAFSSVQGIDGRALTRLPNGAIPFSDGLIYVHASLRSLVGLTCQTTAARLTALAKSARSGRSAASPIVLQPLLPATVQPTKRGYKVAESALAAFPLRVRVNNLANTPKQVSLRCTVNGGAALPERRIELAPQATEEVEWNVDLAAVLRQSGVEAASFEVKVQEDGGEVGSPLALEMFCERDLATYLRLYPASTPFDITDMARWKPNIAPIGVMKMTALPEHVWQLQTTFKPGDRWAFPEFHFPENAVLKGSSGLIVRARAVSPATVRLMVKERGGSTYFTPFSLVAADGAWHALVLNWADLAALPSAPPDPNGQLDLDKIESITLGLNPKADENTLEVSDLYVARKHP